MYFNIPGLSPALFPLDRCFLKVNMPEALYPTIHLLPTYPLYRVEGV